MYVQRHYLANRKRTAKGTVCQEKSVVATALQDGYSVSMDQKRTFDCPLQVRITADQLKLFKKAAKKDGRSLSNWIRNRLTKAAEKELKS